MENEIERVVVFVKEGAKIKTKNPSDKLKKAGPITRKVVDLFTDEEGRPLTYEEFEKKYIRFILSQVGGNKTKAAQIMGIPRSTLRGKMRKLGLSE